MADGVGFEPTEGVNPRRFSRPVQSTTLPPIPTIARCSHFVYLKTPGGVQTYGLQRQGGKKSRKLWDAIARGAGLWQRRSMNIEGGFGMAVMGRGGVVKRLRGFGRVLGTVLMVTAPGIGMSAPVLAGSVLAGSVLAGSVLAAEKTSAEGAAEETQPFESWLAAFRQEAAAAGIGAQTLDDALDGVAPIARVIELDRRQPEFTRTFWTYLGNRVTEARIEHGREMLAKHRARLDRVARRHGVPAHYLVSFWGMETNFGRHLGSFPVIDSLATLAHDPRRSDFFRAELLDALRIVDGGHIGSKAMKGSWAGAMGHMQFLPSTFVNHAVDADGDGRKDIWNSLDDAFASGANYLSDMGWKADERWGREVRLPEDFEWTLASLRTRKTLDAWAALGVRRADGGALPTPEGMRGSLVLPQGHEGPAFLVYDNFRAILNWNRSVNYAVAVGHLADRLVGQPALKTGRDVPNEPLSREAVVDLQKSLNRNGFDAGDPDGLPGPQTRAAIRRFQKAAGHPADGHPAPGVLEQLAAYAEAQSTEAQSTESQSAESQSRN